MMETTETTTHGVETTDVAASKVRSLRAGGRDDLRLRVAVQPGGCSGLIYQALLRRCPFIDGDATRDFDGVEVVGDKMSVPYLEGATIDFADTIEKQGFNDRQPQRGRLVRLRDSSRLRPSSCMSTRPDPQGPASFASGRLAHPGLDSQPSSTTMRR